MVGTLALSGAVLLKAGTNCSSNFKTTNAEANIVPLINQAEAFINVATKKNWIDIYSTLDADKKLILEEAVSVKIIIGCIKISTTKNRITAPITKLIAPN